MISLLLDTHNDKLTIIIYKDDKVLDMISKNDTKNHSEIFMPLLISLLEKNKMSVHDINEIIAIVGPGSFTGIRLGVTVAKTLAYTLNIPIKSLTSLEACYDPKMASEYILQEEKNGFYGAHIINNELKDYFYLTIKEYNEWSKTNNYVICDQLQVDRIPLIIKDKKSENPHSVNPLYVKKIEALKWLLKLK